MVKLYALHILYKNLNSAVWLKTAYDVQSFGYFQRGTAQDTMAFASKTIVERTQSATRQSVKEGGKPQNMIWILIYLLFLVEKHIYNS